MCLFFCLFAHDHSSAVQFVQGVNALCCHPSGTSFFCAFCFERTFVLYSSGFVHVFVRDVPWEVITIWIFITEWFRNVHYWCHEGASSHSETTSASPAVEKKTQQNPITFTNHSSISAHIFLSHTKKNLFWFQMVSSGSFKKKRKEKKITLFVRKTKYSYAILNLLCLGCRYAVPK